MLGTIAHLSDSGIPIHFFTGNHDMWSFTYFQEELGVKLYKEPILKEIDGKKFFLGHGDGLGPGDKGYKFIKKIFSNKFCQWLFAQMHPNIGIGLANYFSRKSRMANAQADEVFLGENEEWLLQFCKDYLSKNPPVDYFIFGHRHLPLDILLEKGARYINLGEWVKFNSYAVFDGKELELKFFETNIIR